MTQEQRTDGHRNAAEPRLQRAIAALRRNPRDVAALRTCFDVYRARGDHANAAKVLDVMSGIDPGAGWVGAERAALLLAGGRANEAATSVLQALAMDPSDMRANAVAGDVFSELNKLAAGEYHFRRALHCDPADAGLLTLLGRNLMQQGRIEEAETIYRRARGHEPENVQTLAYLAQLLEVQGRLDEADSLLTAAEKLRPGSVSLLRAKVLARRGETRQALAVIDAATRLNGDALLARGQLHQAMGDYNRAWEDFADGKRALAQEMGGVRYEADAVERFFAALRSAFTAERMSILPRASVRNDTPQPMFIVGAPRSGTTLLERILSNHTAVEAGGELPFVGEFREYLIRLLPDAPFPENVMSMAAGEWRAAAALLRDFYLARRSELRPTGDGCRYVVDKMPFNEMYLPLIRIAFPDCPVIHLQRHPLDIAVSVFEHKLNHGFYCAYSLDGIAHHLSSIAALHRAYREAFDTNETTVRYEDLVASPESAVRALLDRLGLAFESACLEADAQPRYSPTPSYARVNQAISGSAVGRHRHYEARLRPILPQFGSLLSDGGYQPAWTTS